MDVTIKVNLVKVAKEADLTLLANAVAACRRPSKQHAVLFLIDCVERKNCDVLFVIGEIGNLYCDLQRAVNGEIITEEEFDRLEKTDAQLKEEAELSFY